MSDAGEQWQVARRRRKGTPRGGKPLQATPTCQDELNATKTIQRIREIMSELKIEEFWQDWQKQLLVSWSKHWATGEEDKISIKLLEKNRDDTHFPELECVCYGLGSFSSCVSARYQLAMLLLLLDSLQIPLQKCCVYDPVFSMGEKEVLKQLGLTVLMENEEGKRSVSRPTLFYLMHCGKALYNNLLWKNWKRESLPLLTVVGNSFTGIKDRMIEREFQQDYSYISQAVAVCEERPLPCPSQLLDIFNDTAVITFPSGELSKLPQSSWVEPCEPQYQYCPDLEIILRETLS